jgi:hypothetical protein
VDEELKKNKDKMNLKIKACIVDIKNSGKNT